VDADGGGGEGGYDGLVPFSGGVLGVDEVAVVDLGLEGGEAVAEGLVFFAVGWWG